MAYTLGMQKQITALTGRLRHAFLRLGHLLKRIDSAFPKIDLYPPDSAAASSTINERRLFIGGRTVVICAAVPGPARLPVKANSTKKHAA